MSESPSYSSKASIGMVRRIPGGYFRMGSRFHPREEPPRSVFVAEFDIAQGLVTVNQYSAFLESDHTYLPRWWDQEGREWLRGHGEGWGRESRLRPDGWEVQARQPHHPVVGVTLFEAKAYCAWISYQKKVSARLPAEEEWEYAARGDDGRPFPWGDYFESSRANTLESERMTTVEAGSLSGDTSPFGVVDMAGNVQEWTTSPYTPLPGEVAPGGKLFVARGGSFNDTAYGSRASYRRGYPPGYYFSFLGFRVIVGHR
jgi:formylglycine-generating enzyme required for sulfatase activity